ncbi:MAG: hypothetical protein ACRC57_10360 [Sarcina sp.]
MKKMKINFSLDVNSLDNSLLDIKVFISDIPKMDVLHIFRGKSKISNLKCFVPMNDDKQFLHFNINGKSSLMLEYTAKISNLAKHGHFGFMDKQYISFAGEQVFLLPFEALNLGSSNSNFEFEITVDYRFPAYKNCIIPFKNNNQTCLITNDWGDMFELLKSSYTFHNFEYSYSKNNLSIYSQENILNNELTNDLFSLYNYYAELFKIEIPVSITLLKKTPTIGIFAGSSRTSITASFSPEDKRDFELLAHRLFHSFMDTRLNNVVFHMPPNLWVTEGLATYYEHKSLEFISEKTKERLQISFNKSFEKLYRIYLYSITKNEKLYNFPPLYEGSLKSLALIEYLHYTKAPLLIRFFEENGEFSNTDNFINYLLSLESLENFEQPNMFKAILKDKTNDFAVNYIFGAKQLPIDLDISENTEIIREELTEFETTMSTWFNLDNVKPPVEEVLDSDLNIFK